MNPDLFDQIARRFSERRLSRRAAVSAVAPAADLPSTEMDPCVGHFADPGQALTVAKVGDGLEVTLQTIDRPGAFVSTLNPPPPPPLPVTFLARDAGIMAETRLPFVRDADGRVGWVSSDLRLLPRIDVKA